MTWPACAASSSVDTTSILFVQFLAEMIAVLVVVGVTVLYGIWRLMHLVSTALIKTSAAFFSLQFATLVLFSLTVLLVFVKVKLSGAGLECYCLLVAILTSTII